MTPYHALQKAKTLKKRNYKLEKLIAESPQLCFEYAKNVLHEPFLEGEKIIASDSFHSYMYARYVLNGPFILGHHSIFNSEFEVDYLDFLKSIKCNLKEEIREWLI